MNGAVRANVRTAALSTIAAVILSFGFGWQIIVASQ
jgi:hypothetical protein